MASLTRTEAARYLMAHDRFSIVTHRRPDGDTIGSSALLCLGLRQLGKTAHVIHNPEITQKYTHLHQGLTKALPDGEDTVVCVDVASSNMLPAGFPAAEYPIGLRIDHHRTSTPFTADALVDPAAAACGQIVYDVLMEMGVQLDTPMANALYTAISTDTGCFRYANTQSHTFEVAAACAKVTPDLYALNQSLFGVTSLARLKIQSWMLEHALFLADGKIAVCALPLEVEKHIGVTEDDMENISGFPRSIEGVQIAATLRQNESGEVKLSVRAVPEYDAGSICAKFGGGGHRGAAGASLNMPLNEAVEAVIAAMPKL